MEKMSVEILKQIKSNTQIRFQQDENCVVISVHGPYQIWSQKANQQAILEIQIKFEQDKSLEQQLNKLSIYKNIHNSKQGFLAQYKLIQSMCLSISSFNQIFSNLYN